MRGHLRARQLLQRRSLTSGHGQRRGRAIHSDIIYPNTNVFIEAKNRYYAFDVCPVFWDWIDASHRVAVLSVDKVRDELIGGGDELAEWAKQRGEGFFLKPDQAAISSLRAVSQWAASRGYTPAAVRTFLRAADYYLVAQAHAAGHTVVTHEVAANSPRRIKIPNACHSLGVSCIDPFES
jgi:hypothetical protein